MSSSLSLAVPAVLAADEATLSHDMFQSGMEHMKAGALEQACPAFAESFRLEPLPGTLFTLAECEARLGKTASAVARYDDYLEIFARLSPADRAGQRRRPQIAAAKRAELLPRVPHLTLHWTSPPGSDIAIFRDDTRLGAPAAGVALPIDPGPHTLRLVAGGRQVLSLHLEVKEGEKLELSLPLPPAPTDLPGQAGGVAASPTVASSPMRRRSNPWAGPLALTGGTLAAAGIASYALAWSKSNAIEEAARAGAPYPESAGNYRRWEWAAASVGLGGAGLLAAAAYLYLTSRPHVASAVAFTWDSLEVRIGPELGREGFAWQAALRF